MNPLSLFPDLFTFSLFAPLLLRVIAGVVIFYLGVSRYKKALNWSSVFYILCSVSLILGLYAQLGAILGILVVTFDYFVDKESIHTSHEKMMMYFLLSGILLSILVTGPGFLAFDLPL